MLLRTLGWCSTHVTAHSDRSGAACRPPDESTVRRESRSAVRKWPLPLKAPAWIPRPDARSECSAPFHGSPLGDGKRRGDELEDGVESEVRR